MKKSIFGILMGLGFMACKPIWAETYVSGTITNNTTWILANSPYVVTDTVTVASDIALTIEPGVTVRFGTETSLICYGTLNAIGIPLGTITFTLDQGTHTASHWKGIKLLGSGAQRSQISYCDIGFAKQAIYLENVPGIVVTNNFIHDNKGDDGASGSAQAGDGGCGIYLLNSNNNLIGTNTIKNNEGGQGGTGVWKSGGCGGTGCGIYLLQSTNNTISENIISNNTGGQGGTGGMWGSGGSGGIGTGIYFSNSTNNTISENIISNNTGGQGGTGGMYGSAGNPGQGYGIYIEPNSYNNIIGSSNTYNNEPIFYYYNQSGITIENQNLTLQGSGSTNLGRIVLINCSNFIIRNNSIAGGIGSNGESNPQTGYDYISFSPKDIGAGIYLGSSTNIVIINNTISKNNGGYGGSGGGYLCGGQGGTGTGIYLLHSNRVTVINNALFDNNGGNGGGSGWEAGNGDGGVGCGIYLDFSSDNVIIDNAISSNKGGNGGNGGKGGGAGGIGAGICLFSSGSNIIEGNNISNIIGGNGGNVYYYGPYPGGKGIGIYLFSSNNNNIRGNTISNNIGGQAGTGGSGGGLPGCGYGIYSISNSSSTIHYNNLSGNKNGDNTKGYGVYHDGSFATISATCNWWGHSSGPEHPITNPLGQGDKVSDWVDYKPWLPAITSLAPSFGLVGTTITVQGMGFATNTLVSIDFGTHPTITTTQSSINGTFSTTFIVSTQSPGTKLITATDSYGNLATTTFVLLPPTFLRVIPQSRIVAKGDEFVEEIRIDDVLNLKGAEVHLSFNPNVLEVLELNNGPFPSGGMVIKNYNNTLGYIDYTVIILTGSSSGS
ncbi:MAG: right-handed parallel beta-helix repeat-containing protein, partial [bacterium]